MYIVGAADPEADFIARKLRAEGEDVAFALGENGKRVHPGIAYEAVWPIPEDGQIWIECAPAGGFAGTQVVRIDHHSPGDPGYAFDYRQYWCASSVGQVFRLNGWKVTEKARVAAAADHCLYEAYRGMCEGVKPWQVLSWKMGETIRRHNIHPSIVAVAMVHYAKILDRKTPIPFEGGCLNA